MFFYSSAAYTFVMVNKNSYLLICQYFSNNTKCRYSHYVMLIGREVVIYQTLSLPMTLNDLQVLLQLLNTLQSLVSKRAAYEVNYS